MITFKLIKERKLIELVDRRTALKVENKDPEISSRLFPEGRCLGQKDWRRWIVAILGLICVCVAVLVAPNKFSEYSLDPEHLLSHWVFSALVVLCGVLLIRGGIAEVLARLKTLDLSTFDAFQYALARRILSLASSTTKIHTGDLNLNMLAFLVGFIICLLSLLGFAFF